MKNILYWTPPILLMIAIFYLSSQPRFTATGEPLEDFLIFKFLHACEYGLLAWLLFNALYNTFVQKISSAIRYAAITAIFYAMTDELHQVFVPTRSGTVRDVLIDSIGVGIALYLIYVTYRSKKAHT